MEEGGVPRVAWDGEAKAVQQCLTDIFTSVYTTCDIPESAIFGPCVLSHTSLYDSIAFVALKSTDKRTVPYIFRVDTSAANGSSEGLMWLRLVQSARDKEEQNLEAYIKNGQLFYRSLRRIAKDEELLVWYGKELTELLLLTSTRAHSKMNGSTSYTCLECSQRFQFEYPYAAHLRFRCPKRLHGSESPAEDSSTKDSSKGQEGTLCSSVHKYPDKANGGPQHRPQYPQDAPGGRIGGCSTKPTTDFHNLARELENSRGGGGGSSPSEGGAEAGQSQGKAKRKQAAGEAARGRPERPREELACTPAQHFRGAGSYFGLEEGSRLLGPPSPETGEAKRSAFVEVKKAARGPEEEHERGSPPPAEKAAPPQLLGGRGGGGSAFSAVAPEERKSAFSQPPRAAAAAASSSPPGAPLALGQKLGEEGVGGRLYAQEALPGAKAQGEPAGGGLGKGGPFLYAAPFWPKSALAGGAAPLQLQLPSALTLLPPSFASLCLPAQNWCAKCNASFRMTSDLVYHMRSHHKKEYALEPLVKRRREEKLRCPICNESFRERHHLSRHMTSHN